MRNSLSQLCIAAMRNLFQMLIFITLIAVLCILINQYHQAFFKSITEGITHHSIIFRFIRWGVILLIACFWSYFALLMGRHHDVTLDKVIYWQRERFCVVMWLILFELLVCENIVGKFIHLLIGP